MSDQKEYRPLSALRAWDRNPRAIDATDFNRLKEQLRRLGQYKPLVITPDGEILGGNMRYRAMKDMGISHAWVSVVIPKSEAEKIEYALSDNDSAGYYQHDPLAELVSDMPELDLGLYHVNLDPGMRLEDILDDVSPGPDAVDEAQEKEPKTITCPECGHQWEA